MCADKVNEYALENEVDDDFVLDDIEQMPGFITPPTGAYIVSLDKGVQEKEINDENYYDIAHTIISVEEVSDKALDEDEVPPKPGDMFNIIFNRGNKIGMSNFAKYMLPIAKHAGVKTVREARAVTEGLQILIIVKRRYNKKSDRHNIEVTRLAVL